jgi:hypothetical protein
MPPLQRHNGDLPQYYLQGSKNSSAASHIILHRVAPRAYCRFGHESGWLKSTSHTLKARAGLLCVYKQERLFKLNCAQAGSGSAMQAERQM